MKIVGIPFGFLVFPILWILIAYILRQRARGGTVLVRLPRRGVEHLNLVIGFMMLSVAIPTVTGIDVRLFENGLISTRPLLEPHLYRVADSLLWFSLAFLFGLSWFPAEVRERGLFDMGRMNAWSSVRKASLSPLPDASLRINYVRGKRDCVWRIPETQHDVIKQTLASALRDRFHAT